MDPATDSGPQAGVSRRTSVAGRQVVLCGGLLLAGLVFAVRSGTPWVVAQPVPSTLSASYQDTGVTLLPAPDHVGVPRATDLDICPVPRGVLSSHQDAGDSTPLLYTSEAVKSPQPFNAVGFRLNGTLPEGARWELDARSSPDGAAWEDWSPVGQLDAEAGATQESDLWFTEGLYIQYRLAVFGGGPDSNGGVDSVSLTFIDSREGPTAEQAQYAGGPLTRLAALIRPNVIGRSAWGANERLRTWPPGYAPVQKIFIHHTVTNNAPPDAAAAIRAIYYYHSVTQGWGDIGYNFIIDSGGRVYEGRYGGAGVIGAHAEGYNSGSIGVALLGTFSAQQPSEAALRSAEDFLVAKAVQHGIDPNGRGQFLGRDVPNIGGHRDVNSTACPGEELYGRLPLLRERAWAGLPLLGQSWGEDNTPLVAETGANLTVNLVVKNSGRAVWTSQQPNPVRAGFRWYRAGGGLHEEPGLEYHTDIPRPVSPGESVTVAAKLNVPSTPGSYVLVWDMVQERVSWFGEQGNQPLERAVVVGEIESLPNDAIMQLPNDFLTMLPGDRLRSFPLSRLTLLSNTELVRLIPDIIPMFPNDRVLSFSNDMLLRYLPDYRLKTFSLERIRTFPEDVQVRLGFPPPPKQPVGVPTQAGLSTTPVPTFTPRPLVPTPTPARDPGGAKAP